jgi:hypothetical protein
MAIAIVLLRVHSGVVAGGVAPIAGARLKVKADLGEVAFCLRQCLEAATWREVTGTHQKVLQAHPRKEVS